jgi:hypothetical protein
VGPKGNHDSPQVRQSSGTEHQPRDAILFLRRHIVRCHCAAHLETDQHHFAEVQRLKDSADVCDPGIVIMAIPWFVGLAESAQVDTRSPQAVIVSKGSHLVFEHAMLKGPTVYEYNGRTLRRWKRRFS